MGKWIDGWRIPLMLAGLLCVTGPQQAVAFAQKRTDPPPKPKEVRGGKVVKTGELLVVRGMRGGEPQITDQQGKRFLLTGRWRAELLRLHGHTVKVVGELGDKKLMRPTVKVEQYEIVDSGGGRKPLVGRLELLSEDKALVLRQQNRVLPIAGSATLKKRLKRRVGCKVWIVGDIVAGALKVAKFGWLSCKTPAPIKPKKEKTR